MIYLTVTPPSVTPLIGEGRVPQIGLLFEDPGGGWMQQMEDAAFFNAGAADIIVSGVPGYTEVLLAANYTALGPVTLLAGESRTVEFAIFSLNPGATATVSLNAVLMNSNTDAGVLVDNGVSCQQSGAAPIHIH
jgi:hypothetical protein